jgi:Protein of unknown function (DUF2806)
LTEQIDTDSTEVENELGNAIDIIGDTMSGIPAPIKKNALKAFAQLCTAAIDLPIAHLEGIAAEKRAESQARIKIIDIASKQILEQMDVDPEYARAAVKNFGQKIVREKVNLDAIVANAALELSQDQTNGSNNQDELSEVEISSDWLNTFEKEASEKSSEEMRLLFGKILAEEIRRPTSFSIKTIKLISQLDNQAAKIFQLFCSMCVSLQAGNHIIDARVISIAGNAASNSLQSYGLTFDGLNVLHEYGLIIPDYNSYMDYRICIANMKNVVPLPFKYQGKLFGLIKNDEQYQNTEFRLDGVALSKSGKELLNVIDILPVEEYTMALKTFFENLKFQMVQINIP